jgi:hypothetical protein
LELKPVTTRSVQRTRGKAACAPLEQKGADAVRRLIARLQLSLKNLFVQRAIASNAEAQRSVESRLLLGLELMWKLEEQVLLPALQPNEPTHAASRSATRVRDELPLMRDLSLLASKAPQAERGLAFGVLEGLVTLHFARIKDRLDAVSSGTPPPPWTAVHSEMVTTLDRWHGEVLAHGEIEDEDADPVGQPPR